MAGPTNSRFSGVSAVTIVDSGTVSSGNSTTVALTGGSVFTGAWEDVSDQAEITVVVGSDVASAGSGLSMQFSSDGVTLHKPIAVDVAAASYNSHSVHTLVVVAQYFRIVYTNGAVGQANFNLQTIYHTTKSKNLTSRAGQVIKVDQDVETTRVVNIPELDAARGINEQLEIVHKFGSNTDLDEDTTEDVWNEGATYVWQTSAVALEAVSSSGDDAAAGDNAREITVHYLDANWDRQTATLVPGGAAIGAVVLRVNRAYVSSVGTYGATNAGAITLRVPGPGDTLALISAGMGQTQMSMYTVPAGYTGYLTRISASVQSKKEADVRFYRRENADDLSGPPYAGTKRLMAPLDGLEGPSGDRLFRAFIPIRGCSDIWAEATATGNNTKVNVDYDLVLVKD